MTFQVDNKPAPQFQALVADVCRGPREQVLVPAVPAARCSPPRSSESCLGLTGHLYRARMVGVRLEMVSAPS